MATPNLKFRTPLGLTFSLSTTETGTCVHVLELECLGAPHDVPMTYKIDTYGERNLFVQPDIGVIAPSTKTTISMRLTPQDVQGLVTTLRGNTARREELQDIVSIRAMPFYGNHVGEEDHHVETFLRCLWSSADKSNIVMQGSRLSLSYDIRDCGVVIVPSIVHIDLTELTRLQQLFPTASFELRHPGNTKSSVAYHIAFLSGKFGIVSPSAGILEPGQSQTIQVTWNNFVAKESSLYVTMLLKFCDVGTTHAILPDNDLPKCLKGLFELNADKLCVRALDISSAALGSGVQNLNRPVARNKWNWWRNLSNGTAETLPNEVESGSSSNDSSAKKESTVSRTETAPSPPNATQPQTQPQSRTQQPLEVEEFVCGCCQITQFSSDPNHAENAPISSRSCDHTICRSCVSNLQLAKAERIGKRVKHVKCPICNSRKAYLPAKPLVNRALCAAIQVVAMNGEREGR